MHQLFGQGEEFPGDDVHGGSAAQCGVDVLYGGVKVEGRLVGEDLVFVKFEGFAPPLREIDDGPVADENPFGHAGGAGGEDGIYRVCIDGPVLPGLDFLRPHRIRGLELLYVVHGAAFLDRLGKGVLSAGQKVLGSQGIDDQLDPFIGHLHIDGHIKAAGIGNTQKGLNDLYAFVHVYQHGCADAYGIQKTAGNFQGAVLQLGKSDLPVFVAIGLFAPKFLFRDLQIVYNVFDHVLLPPWAGHGKCKRAPEFSKSGRKRNLCQIIILILPQLRPNSKVLIALAGIAENTSCV